MGAVFERDGLRRAAAAVAADDLRRGGRALRHRPARHALRARAHGPRRGRRAARSSRCSPACSAAAAWCAGSTPAPRELPRSELDALTELAKQHGAKGLVWAFVQERRAWRSPIAKFLTPERDRRRSTSGSSAAPGDLLLIVADEADHGRPGARRAAARAGAALRADPGGPPRHPLGGRVPGVLVERRRAALGRRAPPVHRARPAISTIPASLQLARLRPGARRLRDRRRLDPHPPPRGPAAGVRAARDRAPRRRRRGSASCSTRCATARRRTAGSRWGSTGSCARWPGGRSIREVIAFPKAASGADPLTGAPAPVDPAQLRELGLRLA